jgi:PAP2 superfamily
VDNRRPPLWWELPVGLVAFLGCTTLSRASVGNKQVEALANARQVLALETPLGLDLEMVTNRWLAAQSWVASASGYVYAADYVLTSVAVLVFLYLHSPPVYRWARRSCILLNVAAAACFALYPVAPPRFIAEMSIVDTVEDRHIWGTWGSSVGDQANQLAALPSLHFALVLWVLVMLVVATRSVVFITLASINVVLTAGVVVATGNHYVLDLVAGALVALISIPTTHSWPHPPRLRRLPGSAAPVVRFLRVHAVLTTDAQTPVR